MVLYQHAGGVVGVDTLKTLHDDVACLQLILALYLGLGHVVGAGDILVEVVGMCGADVGDVLAGLCPCGGIGGVGVYDTLYVGEGTVEHEVGRSV